MRLGIAASPEGRRVFSGLSVLENLGVGATPWRRRRDAIRDDLARSVERFPRLAERRSPLAWSMSGGEQPMLAVGRALLQDRTERLQTHPLVKVAYLGG